MEYHSIKIQIITKLGKTNQKQILQTFSLTEAIKWLNYNLLPKEKKNAS